MLHSTGSAAAAVAAASASWRAGMQGKCIVFSNFIEAIDSVANSLTEAPILKCTLGIAVYSKCTGPLTFPEFW
jgi:hypothetical protein